MDCCTAHFTIDVGIILSNGWSGSVGDPITITVPSGWSYSPTPGPVIGFVPDPGTLLLVGAGVAGLAAVRACRYRV